jgi:phage FluMu protein Com
MPIPILCPCTAKLRVSDHLRGQRVQCPKCQTVHHVATPTADAGPTPIRKPADIYQEAGLSASQQARLEQELEKGERLVWAGKPVMRSVMLVNFLIGGGALLLAIMLVTIALVAGRDSPNGPSLELLIFGGALTIGGIVWPFYQRYRFGSFVYAITDKRALVWDANFFGVSKFLAYGSADVAGLKRGRAGKDENATGNLVFGEIAIFPWQDLRKKPGSGRAVGFLHVKNPHGVERILREYLIDAYADRLYQ